MNGFVANQSYWSQSLPRYWTALAYPLGMRCLDVGCGPGEVMRLMAQRVGPTGQIVGIDVDTKLGREMLSVLKSKGYEQCSFMEGNLETLEQIDSDRFDLVFA